MTDGDCPDPNNKVCDPSSNLCLPCRASIDCECSADGPICSDYDQYSAGYGACTCMGDGNCMAHIGGPRCVGNGSHFKECGCPTASDCAGNLRVPPPSIHQTTGWLQCGCASTADCPNGQTSTNYVCEWASLARGLLVGTPWSHQTYIDPKKSRA